MKKTTMLILCILILIVGCDEQKDEQKENRVSTSSLEETYTVVCDGHKYVIFNGINKGGIVHAESCECKKNNQ